MAISLAFFSGTPNSRTPTLLPALGILFFLLGCLLQPCYEDFCLVLLYLVLFRSAAIYWSHPYSFSEEEMVGKWTSGRGEVVVGSWRDRDGQNCDQDVLYE